MPTPSQITDLAVSIGPDSIEKFCRLKFPVGQFDRCSPGAGGYFHIDYSDATSPSDPGAPALREFLDLTVDKAVQVIGRFVDTTADLPILVYAIPMKGAIGSRSSRKKQADFARFLLSTARQDLGRYRSDWSRGYSTGLFFFYEPDGNFRMSLIESGEKRFRRFTFFVEHDTTGAKNRTFRYRMTNAESPDRAARGELKKWSTYQDIKAAFSVETLAKEFYDKLFQWYDRACKDQAIEFPNNIDTEADNHDRKPEHLIRLITRLMFVWFIKQKGLVPAELFDKLKLPGVLKGFDAGKGDTYYRAILQNLFFATLNSEVEDRAFATHGTFDENREHFDVKTLYRYRDEFAIPEAEVLALFRSIPFLNGGLFECLDRGRNYFDGFSREPKNVAHIPNKYFFEETEESLGLIPLLNRYHFTVDENAPGDEDVALDPELLGKVFENLLGAYNPETKVAARNATGSFYTPREIVNYMVDESLIAHLLTKCGAEHEPVIRALFAEGLRPADAELCKRLDQNLVTAKILDPACGSGAFPMGVLLRMVDVLRVLRETADGESLYELKLELIENCIYGGDIQCIAVQISKLRFFISLVCEQTRTDDPATNYGINTLPNLETKFVAADSLIGLPADGKNVLDLCSGNIVELKRELWDIRHRHFRARTYREKKDLRKLDEQKRNQIKAAVRQSAQPNAERLAALERERAALAAPKLESLLGARPEPAALFAEFAAPKQQPVGLTFDANEKARKELDGLIEREKKRTSIPTTVVDAIAESLASWDPYDQNTSASFSDPEWMFNVRDGFDIVIGNPPYVHGKSGVFSTAEKAYFKRNYQSAEYQMDTYVLFMERSLRMLAESGDCALIIPNTFLSNNRLVQIRRLLLEECGRLSLTEMPPDVFSAAVVDTVVLLCDVTKPLQDGIDIIRLEPTRHVVTRTLSRESVATTDGYVFETRLDSESRSVTEKMETRAVPLSAVARASRGVHAYRRDGYGKSKFGPGPQTGRDYEERSYHAHQKLDPTYFPETRGKNLHRYSIVASGSYVSWGDWLAEPRDFSLFSGSRIYLRKIVGETLYACSIDAEDVADQSVYIAIPTHPAYSMNYLLGVLNSRVLAWYFRNKNNEFDTLFPQIKVGEFKKLPIPEPTERTRLAIEAAVQAILDAKSADSSANTEELDALVEALVCESYGLDAADVAIVTCAIVEHSRGHADQPGEDFELAAVQHAGSVDPDYTPAPTPTPTQPQRSTRPQDTDLDL